MSEQLHRSDAPFSQGVWDKIDQTVIGAASSQLSGRRLLTVEGPLGLGLKSIPTEDVVKTENKNLASSGVIPLAMIHTEFSLGTRDIAAFQEQNSPLPLGAVSKAAIEAARLEDNIIFNGSAPLGVKGLLNSEGISNVKLGEWHQVGSAVENVISAVSALDNMGFHGPYALALPPGLYNLLFRKYPQGDLTELEHLRQIVTDGIVKSSALKNTGILIATGPQFATIVVGQDMTADFLGPQLGSYQFSISESIVLRLLESRSVCVLGK